MNLPESNYLPINLLSSCFNHTSATYKFYWLLSIVQEIENGNAVIPKKNLFARMISNAWYTINYFHISFGKQDIIQDAIRLVNQVENISVEENLDSVFRKLVESQTRDTNDQLWHFDSNVPHWFLSPWFPGMNKREIYNHSKVYTNQCVYALFSDRIEINPEWQTYLFINARVLKDFCYWNLSLFLQAKNPNVPNIPGKLIKPANRNSLSQHKTKFWNLVISVKGSLKCIFTGENLVIGGFHLDHFIPYNFVSHDLMWNLIPIQPEYNSIKSDKLPNLDLYFDRFFDLQKNAVEIIRTDFPNNKFLEDYLPIFPKPEDWFSRNKFLETMQPLITIAANNGFQYLE